MQFNILKNKELIHGVSDTSFDSIKSASTGLKAKKRALIFLEKTTIKNISLKDLVFAKQVFSAKVHFCKTKDSGKIIKNVDALISNIPGQIIAVTSGDCLPILLFDPKNKVVGAIHGARQSLIDGIIKNTVQAMIFNFNSSAKDILIGIGPHIRKCHYWLKEKTFQGLIDSQFEEYFIFKKDKVYFDMTRLALDDFSSLGIRIKNIEDSSICTFCQFKKYFSVRKQEEKNDIYSEKKPTFASFIGLCRD